MDEYMRLVDLQNKLQSLRKSYVKNVDKLIDERVLAKLKSLERVQVVAPQEEITVPEVKIPVMDYETIDVNQMQIEMIEELQNSILLMEILMKKSKCPISKIIDAI